MEAKKEQLINEITGLMQQMDHKGLEFLKAQASVLLYNQEVSSRKEQKPSAPPGQKERAPEKKESDEFAPHQVSIEQLKNAHYFNLCIRDAKLFMDVHEIKSMFKIAQSAESEEDGAVRLYRWLKKERSDVLVDGSIRKESSPMLKLIYRELLETFSAE